MKILSSEISDPAQMRAEIDTSCPLVSGQIIDILLKNIAALNLAIKLTGAFPEEELRNIHHLVEIDRKCKRLLMEYVMDYPELYEKILTIILNSRVSQ